MVNQNRCRLAVALTPEETQCLVISSLVPWGIAVDVHTKATQTRRSTDERALLGTVHASVALRPTGEIRHKTLEYKIKVRGRVGRPATRPKAVAADKAYSSKGNRSHLRKRGIKGVIPVKVDQVANHKKRGSRGGREYAFDPVLYKDRTSSSPGAASRPGSTRHPRATAPACTYAARSSGSEA